MPVLLSHGSAPAVPVWRPDEPGDCAFSVAWAAAGQDAYAGVTAGLRITRDGLFLFPSGDGFASIERTFIPHAAYRSFDVDPLDSPGAAATGIADLKALLQALDAQETAPVLRIGESLIDLRPDEPDAARADAERQGGRCAAGRSAGVDRRDLALRPAHRPGPTRWAIRSST